MTLTSALRSATSAIETSAKQAAVTSRNLSGVGDPSYVRRDAQVVSRLDGTVGAVTSRQVDLALFDAANLSVSRLNRWDTVAQYADRIAAYQDSQGFSNSPADMVSRLQAAVELAAANPSNTSALTSLVDTARSVSTDIRSAYNTLSSMRSEVDQLISSETQALKNDLSRLEELNSTIVEGTRTGREVFNEQDQRDRIIERISEQIGIKTTFRDNNDVMITLTNGVMLFDGKARDVSFDPVPAFGPTTNGGDLRVDGVPVAGPNTRMPTTSGKLAGLFEVRDQLLTRVQVEYDEVARGLVEVFSETDQSGGGNPPLTGLFAWQGGPNIPASGVHAAGIAASISVNPLVDYSAGGNTALIRDGAINGDPNYLSNLSGGAGFSDRLLEQVERLGQGITFAPGASSSASTSLADFASEALGRLNVQREDVSEKRDYLSALSEGLVSTLQNETGVNLDFEMSRLIEVERSYQASARLIEVVDRLLATLIKVA